MTRKAPGKSHREGLSLIEVAAMFGDEDNARKWIEEQRWPDGPHCPRCGSLNVKVGVPHNSMTHRCNDCPKKSMFSVKVGTVMEGSKLPYRVWAVGIYLFTTNLKGISSMKLHRELKIGQKAAWFMLARLRKAHEAETGPFQGPVGIDETYVGGQRKNMPRSKRKQLTGRGALGETAIVGAKDKKSNRVKARAVQSVDSAIPKGFAEGAAAADARVYTDEAKACKGMARDHEAVSHSVGEYVRNQAQTNGIESFWAMLKRGYHGPVIT